VTIASLKALADENKIPSIKVAEALTKYGIDPEKLDPARN
jgi:pyruvate dehydrogenase E1 component